MKAVVVVLFGFFAAGLLYSPASIAAEKIGPRLSGVMNAAGQDEQIYAWVYFADKGANEALRNSVPHNVVSERSIQRRLKVRSASAVVDYDDLPVEESYVTQVESIVSRLRQRTKWFNGVSVIATKAQIASLEALPFVREIELVARFKRDRDEDAIEATEFDSPSDPQGGNTTSSFNYGSALNQVNQINVVAVHDLGNYAQGVMVGVYDNGFRLLTHQAFDTLRPRIVATYDWVDHKVSVVPNNTSTAFGSHGVNTLSTIGGFREGQLIGPAFGATYILARTENDSSETPVEEDNWIAAIEWGDSIGVDVTSTSLSYLDYDPPYVSWTWQDMNGNTTPITRAADAAVGRGIIVVNAASNSGYNASHNTLGAPADGDSVLTVGAVTSSGTISSFSSCGPTTSVPPRIKPDVCAQGSSVRVASSSNTTGYTSSSGTSFSCPLAAGVAALIVKAHPTATPMQIIGAMKATASRSSSPDNQYGWGILDALAAINYLGATSVGGEADYPTKFVLEQNYPNPFNPHTTIRYYLPEVANVTLAVYDVLGRRVKTLVSGEQSASTHSSMWDGTDESGAQVASGMYFYTITAANSAGTFTQQNKMMLVK